jgi:hypothetical protein
MKRYTLRFWNPPKAWEKNPTYNNDGVACYKGQDCDTYYEIFYFEKNYKNKNWALKAYKKYLKQGKQALNLYCYPDGEIAVDDWFANPKDAE